MFLLPRMVFCMSTIKEKERGVCSSLHSNFEVAFSGTLSCNIVLHIEEFLVCQPKVSEIVYEKQHVSVPRWNTLHEHLFVFHNSCQVWNFSQLNVQTTSNLATAYSRENGFIYNPTQHNNRQHFTPNVTTAILLNDYY